MRDGAYPLQRVEGKLREGEEREIVIELEVERGLYNSLRDPHPHNRRHPLGIYYAHICYLSGTGGPFGTHLVIQVVQEADSKQISPEPRGPDRCDSLLRPSNQCGPLRHECQGHTDDDGDECRVGIQGRTSHRLRHGPEGPGIRRWWVRDIWRDKLHGGWRGMLRL